MGAAGGPNGVEDGLVFSVDSRDIKSNPRTGTTWYDRSPIGAHFSVEAPIVGTSTMNFSNRQSSRVSPTAWRGTSELTIDTWFYAATGGLHSGCCDTLFGRYDFRFFVINNSLYTMISFNNAGARYYQHPNLGFNYDEWHHAVGMRRNDKFIIWLDGVERYNGTFGAGKDLYNVGGDFQFAQSRHSNLQIAKARVWDRGLSDAEIEQVYNNDRSYFGR